MSRILSRRFPLSFVTGGVSLINSPTHLGCPLNYFAFTVRLLSTSCYEYQERPFVVSYLINSCGLSPQSAESVSRRINFQTSVRPDSVLCLLKGYGFTPSHISKLIKKNAQLLLADPAKTLLPKLEFLCSIGISSSDLPDIICSNPLLLIRSLHNTLVPTYNILRSVLGSDKEVFQSLSMCFGYSFYMIKDIPVNIALLRKLKIPNQKISFMLIYAPNVVTIDPNKFSENVKKVIELGIDPQDKLFVHTLQVISQFSQNTLEQKMEVYRSVGLSEEQILLAFKKFPSFMTKSVKKITTTMDILVDKMGYKPEDVLSFPQILGYSLEKRIIPRFSVVRHLQLKGLVRADVSFSTVMSSSENKFLNAFVIKYKGKVPELLSIYQGQMSVQELASAENKDR